MERLYPPSKFRCSKPIALKEYFKQYVDQLLQIPEDYNDKKTEKEKIEFILDYKEIYDEKKRVELAQLCREFESNGGPRRRKSRISKTKRASISSESEEGSALHRTRIKYQNQLENLFEMPRKDKAAYTSELMMPYKSFYTNIKARKEFAVAIRVYYPFEGDIRSESVQKLKFSHEIVVLGSNTLADLRDKIACRADLGLCTEVEHPDSAPTNPPSAKEKYPSGFIFIENVFYNDMRNEAAIDYSEVIRIWAKKTGIEPLKVEDMDKTLVSDLTLRFGYVYLYLHQGDCEHVLTFSNAWLLSSTDPLNTSDYPYIKSVQHLQTKQCILCYKCTAEWICYNYNQLPHVDGFLCKGCLISYCYDGNGKKRGNFKLYPYFDESCPSMVG